jgi:hypothetical protein
LKTTKQSNTNNQIKMAFFQLPNNRVANNNNHSNHNHSSRRGVGVAEQQPQQQQQQNLTPPLLLPHEFLNEARGYVSLGVTSMSKLVAAWSSHRNDQYSDNEPENTLTHFAVLLEKCMMKLYNNKSPQYEELLATRSATSISLDELRSLWQRMFRGMHDGNQSVDVVLHQHRSEMIKAIEDGKGEFQFSDRKVFITLIRTRLESIENRISGKVEAISRVDLQEASAMINATHHHVSASSAKNDQDVSQLKRSNLKIERRMNLLEAQNMTYFMQTSSDGRPGCFSLFDELKQDSQMIMDYAVETNTATNLHFDTLEDDVRKLSEKMSQMDEKMDANKEELKKHSNIRFLKVESSIDGIQQDVAGLKQDVAGLKQDVAGLKQDVVGLKQDVAGLQQVTKNLAENMEVKFDLLFKHFNIPTGTPVDTRND